MIKCGVRFGSPSNTDVGVFKSKVGHHWCHCCDHIDGNSGKEMAKDNLNPLVPSGYAHYIFQVATFTSSE